MQKSEIAYTVLQISRGIDGDFRLLIYAMPFDGHCGWNKKQHDKSTKKGVTKKAG